jgi:hypothetical protein
MQVCALCSARTSPPVLYHGAISAGAAFTQDFLAAGKGCAESLRSKSRPPESSWLTISRGVRVFLVV